MPARVEDEWSDSDDEYGSSGDIETNVQLGLPDGPITAEEDLKDPRVSRIGGHPVFLVSSPPDVSVSQCKNCSNPMQLVSQIWCPIEDSPLDRSMYVWVCANGKCQKKDGSVRAWRCVRFNKKYAEKLERKAARKKEQEKKVEELSTGPKSNPFSLAAPPEATSSFSLGSQIFGATAEDEDPVPPEPEFEDDDHDSDTDDGSEGSEDTVDEETEELAEALAKATLSDAYATWQAMPAYPPLYLSTISEYLPPEPKAKGNSNVDDRLGDGKSKGGLEAYENSMNLDEIFSRFTKRVECEGKQSVRYELGGNPLPYQADAIFQRLFPASQSAIARRVFSPSSLPKCSKCGSDRVFECQLMPNLINVLGSTIPSKAISDEERRKAVEKELKERSGMEWGTVMIFSCAADCCPDGKEYFAEEEVLIQWEA